MAEEARWYVVHTYSGYEKQVKTNIEQTIVNRNLQDQILEVMIPVQNVLKVTKTGAKKQAQKKIFPAYVLIHMIMNDDTWYVVRNTRGVTGFVGPGSKPVPLTDEEMQEMRNMLDGGMELDFAVGDTVTIISGVWENQTGVIQQINLKSQSVIINVNFFGRETPAELNFTDIRKD